MRDPSALRLLLTSLAVLAVTACGSSDPLADSASGAYVGTAPVSARSGCALATYPSVEWTLCETQNAAISQEPLARNTAMLPQTLAATAAYQPPRLGLLVTDPERQPNPNSCTLGLCPIDPRLLDWADLGGIVEPVLFTSRSGATLSGRVWATQDGPAKRPGIVIINGSIIGYEEAYWFLAQSLARAGFVVMTFDAQGEGMSDQFGEAPDQLETAFAGIPVLGLLGPDTFLGGNGRPFYDGGSDAVNFLLSTPAQPYTPVPSRTSTTSHAPKQQRRVAAGLNPGHNPLWAMLDPSRIGVTGHSYGAVAASWLGQSDPRISAIVALDSLCLPVWPSPDEVVAILTAPVNLDLAVPGFYGIPRDCFGAPEGPAPALTKPALSITADYFLPTPYLVPPKPENKSLASLAYSRAGVDTGSIVIRGATHLDFNDSPIPVLPYTLRGQDLVAWYTTAWFAKYLQGNPDADHMLLTARWRDDAIKGSADLAGDPNLYSWHYHSRLDVVLGTGERFICENLREGCVGQYRAEEDCGMPDYSFVSVSTTQEGAAPLRCSSAR